MHAAFISNIVWKRVNRYIGYQQKQEHQISIENSRYAIPNCQAYFDLQGNGDLLDCLINNLSRGPMVQHYCHGINIIHTSEACLRLLDTYASKIAKI